MAHDLTQPERPADADPSGAVPAARRDDAAPSDAERPLSSELRDQARAVGDRLKESLHGQVTGRVVRGVGRLLRQLGNRRGPAADEAPHDLTDTPPEAAPAPASAPADAPERPPAAPDLEALLAQFHERRQARERRRLERRRVQAAVPP
ncbi:MAG: hypothetical protein GX595_07020, partial [Lentisphaerae bacterium]|nr:hypothetical protein [Lentisphaerota bacterium]